MASTKQLIVSLIGVTSVVAQFPDLPPPGSVHAFGQRAATPAAETSTLTLADEAGSLLVRTSTTFSLETTPETAQIATPTSSENILQTRNSSLPINSGTFPNATVVPTSLPTGVFNSFPSAGGSNTTSPGRNSTIGAGNGNVPFPAGNSTNGSGNGPTGGSGSGGSNATASGTIGRTRTTTRGSSQSTTSFASVVVVTGSSTITVDGTAALQTSSTSTSAPKTNVPSSGSNMVPSFMVAVLGFIAGGLLI